MLSKLEIIKEEALVALESVTDQEGLHKWRSASVGRKSPLMETFTKMGGLTNEERPKVGQRANEVKQVLEAAMAEKQTIIKEAKLQSSLKSDKLDVTLPGREMPRGRLHPITQTMRNIYRIFGEMGFQIYRSREVETDEYNFTYLNIPEHHPARDLWDTFHTSTPGVLLRTHTSPGQIHAMREYAPENIRVILPGMVYRYEQVTSRAEMQFTQ
ncbi:MAG: phenylalanine--tRNA ligase subunit alpha, partial [Chloroflexota bacterium]